MRIKAKYSLLNGEPVAAITVRHTVRRCMIVECVQEMLHNNPHAAPLKRDIVKRVRETLMYKGSDGFGDIQERLGMSNSEFKSTQGKAFRIVNEQFPEFQYFTKI